jgi:arginase
MPGPRLIGLPYDGSSSFLRGSAEAPPAIRAVLTSSAGNSYSEALKDINAPGGLTDAGDVVFAPGANPREVIETAIAREMADGSIPIALGGDHSVTYPILRAIAKAHKDLTILHIDAHGDLYPEFEGDRYSHACPFARIMEESLAKRLVQVGIRTLTPIQRAQADKYPVEIVDMRSWETGARPTLSAPVYISIDLDGIDPAFAPGVSHREPGGLSVRDVITLIQRASGPIVGADIVEYNPRQDLGGVTASVAAKLVKELASRMM